MDWFARTCVYISICVLMPVAYGISVSSSIGDGINCDQSTATINAGLEDSFASTILMNERGRSESFSGKHGDFTCHHKFENHLGCSVWVDVNMENVVNFEYTYEFSDVSKDYASARQYFTLDSADLVTASSGSRSTEIKTRDNSYIFPGTIIPIPENPIPITIPIGIGPQIMGGTSSPLYSSDTSLRAEKVTDLIYSSVNRADTSSASSEQSIYASNAAKLITTNNIESSRVPYRDAYSAIGITDIKNGQRIIIEARSFTDATSTQLDTRTQVRKADELENKLYGSRYDPDDAFLSISGNGVQDIAIRGNLLINKIYTGGEQRILYDTGKLQRLEFKAGSYKDTLPGKNQTETLSDTTLKQDSKISAWADSSGPHVAIDLLK